MDTLDNIRIALDINGNLSSELRDNIFELVVVFNKQFPDVDLSGLKEKLSTIKIEKLNKFLNNDVSMYNNKTNVLYFNAARFEKGYDAKHVLMFELLKIITTNGDKVGFDDENGKFEALNVGFTEILANYLVGNEGDICLYQDEAIETNLIAILIGNDVLEKAYFDNNPEIITKRFSELGVQL